MNRRHILLTVALSLAAVLVEHALYGWLGSPPVARAAAEPRRASQWEYCAVVKSQTPTPRLFYWIVYFKEDGTPKIETVEASFNGSSQTKAIAKLGTEGWEMVGEGQLDIRPGSTPAALFFRRRKG